MILDIPMADCSDTHTQVFHSHSQSSRGGGGKDMIEIEQQVYEDAVPFEDTVVLDSETQLEKHEFDTEVVDDLDCVVEDERLQPLSECENEKEVALDSEDEVLCGTETVTVVNGLSDVDTYRRIKGNEIVGSQKRQPSQQLEDLAEDSYGSAGEQIGADFARLKYIGFKESGESSQDNALDFVDHFLSLNNVGFSPHTERRFTAMKKSSPLPISHMKGPQSLAKCIESKIPVEKYVTFEYVDSDQHGRFDFFGKRMDIYGGLQEHSAIRYQKARHMDSRGGSRSGGVCEKSVSLCKEVIGSPHVDSGVAVHSAIEICRIEQVSETNTENNPVNDPNQQVPVVPSGEELGICGIERDTSDLFDIGFNTQMAAEAMEALSYGSSASCSAADAYQGLQNSPIDSSSVINSKVQFRKSSLQKGDLYNLENIDRKPKQRKCYARKGTSNTMWNHKLATTTTKMKRSEFLVGKLNGENVTCANDTLAKILAKPIEQKNEKEAVCKNNTKESENYKSSLAPFENISLSKQQIHGELAAVPAGRWMTGAELGRTKDGSDKPGERTKEVTEGSLITYRRKRSRLSAKPSEWLNDRGKCTKLCFNTSGDAANNKMTEKKQSILEVSVLSSSLKLDEWTCPKGRRTHHKRQSHLNGACNQCIPFTVVDRKEHKRPYKKNLPKSSLLKELIRLGVPKFKPDYKWKDLRKRRDMAYFKVLFSQHLGDDIIKQQKKILARLGISIATCLVDATHFIADRFVRTRNMLEAIALGKPVVTPLWLESCGQASCLIDEKNYILRDAKKEKEIGFSLPISLAHASQHPLLKSQRVLVTPNIKPDKGTITSLVKAVHGQAVEKSQISALKIPNDLLILSCEEDHAICEPFLDKGAAVYSSELLLNGIVIQKLEYERHQLFVNPAKRNCPS